MDSCVSIFFVTHNIWDNSRVESSNAFNDLLVIFRVLRNPSQWGSGLRFLGLYPMKHHWARKKSRDPFGINKLFCGKQKILFNTLFTGHE